jgi:MoaA/NifB/PqqE/SkfB family radical SAM enzyme
MEGWDVMVSNIFSHLNIELTSRCNKTCWMCGRREREKLYGDQQYGDIALEVALKIAGEVPQNTVVAFHNNGEPLLYDPLALVLERYAHCIRTMVTNGKLLVQRAPSIIGLMETISVSIIENDSLDEANYQREQLEGFVKIKGNRKPNVVLRFVGDVDETRYAPLGLLHSRRTLHLPKGSVRYRVAPMVPEYGICLDFLTHLSIDRRGNVSCCVRFDPMEELVLGNAKDQSLAEIWNGPKRQQLLEFHKTGRRKEIAYCGDKCEFWGIPTK